MSAMTMEFDGVRELSMEEIEAVSGGESQGGGGISACTAMGVGGIALGIVGFALAVAATPVTGGGSMVLWAVGVATGGAGVGMGAAGAACAVVTELDNAASA